MAVLPLVNAVLGFAQEIRSNAALALLRQQLTVQARVRRDGCWRMLAAELLVPGDLVRLRMGDMTPADVQLRAGALSIDRSALIGIGLQGIARTRSAITDRPVIYTRGTRPV